MAITAKPKKSTGTEQSKAIVADEQKAMDFIRQGGSVAKPVEDQDDEKTVGVILRMYPDLRAEIDSYLKSLPKRKRPSRNAWILQAIEEKLKRDIKKIS
jgi:hypothetical protein